MTVTPDQLVKTKSVRQSYPAGFSVSAPPVFSTPPGLSEDVVRAISAQKGEPEWMLEKRLPALKFFQDKPLPTWGPDLSSLRFDQYRYYLRSDEQVRTSWDEVPAEIKETFERLGVPQAERAFFAGQGAQFDSEAVYHKLHEGLAKLGVIFLDTDTALKLHPELFRKYFGTVVPAADNKFAALNSAVWSGGSFLYVPPGVQVKLPLSAYFRINAPAFGQFERTLIIADEGSFVSYQEGCTAPVYARESLHAAVVEIIVQRGARVRYTTVQNWSKNVYNLVTKRAQVYRDATMEWIDGNLGSAITMKYPSVFLMEPGARGEILSLAMAGAGQQQDAGGKAVHLAPRTSSVITSKSVCFDGGRASYRGLVRVNPAAAGSRSHVVCDALILDSESRSDTYPTMDVRTDDATIEHEASVSRLGEEQLFYLRSRGLSEAQARSLMVNGFFEPIIKTLPLEYAVEFNRLVEMEVGIKN